MSLRDRLHHIHHHCCDTLRADEDDNSYDLDDALTSSWSSDSSDATSDWDTSSQLDDDYNNYSDYNDCNSDDATSDWDTNYQTDDCSSGYVAYSNTYESSETTCDSGGYDGGCYDSGGYDGGDYDGGGDDGGGD